MDSYIKNRNQRSLKNEEEEEVLRINKPTDMTRIKQAKIYRNEVGSKTNNKLFNFLKF